MKLTTRGRYAVTALLDIALQEKNKPVTVGEIAERHHIPTAYLERLTGQMRANGLLKSVRGAKGGYLLGRASEAITIADIIEAVNENVDATRCKGKGNCHQGVMCLTHHLWDALNQEMFEFLKRITLQSLVNKPKILNIKRVYHESSAIF